MKRNKYQFKIKEFIISVNGINLLEAINRFFCNYSPITQLMRDESLKLIITRIE